MKKGYKIETKTYDGNKFFYAFNFKGINEVVVYGYHKESEKSINSEFCLGVWKIKYKLLNFHLN